jgi:hypothetical protein
VSSIDLAKYTVTAVVVEGRSMRAWRELDEATHELNGQPLTARPGFVTTTSIAGVR